MKSAFGVTAYQESLQRQHDLQGVNLPKLQMRRRVLEAHLLPLRPGVQGMCFGHIEDSDALGSQPLQSAAARDIVGLAGNPETVQSMSPRWRQDQSAGSLSITSSTECRLDRVSDVTCILDDVVVPTHPQSNTADMALEPSLQGHDGRQRIKSRLTIAPGIARARAGSPIPSCNTTSRIVVAQ
jgi:hypothetical protein